MNQFKWPHIIFIIGLLCLKAEVLATPIKSISQETSILDSAGHISSETLIPLQNKIDQFLSTHQLPVYVMISEQFPVGIQTDGLQLAKSHFKIDKSSDYIIFIVEINRKISSIHFKSGFLRAERGLIKQLNDQFIQANLGTEKTTSLGQALSYAIDAIDNLIKNNNGITKLFGPKQNTDYSKKFRSVMYFFSLAIILHMTFWFRKSIRGGKRYENTLFYPLSRINPTAKWVMLVSLLVLICYWLYGYIFYYDELFTAFFILLLAIVPIGTPLFHAGFIAQDILTAKKVGPKNNTVNTLGVIPACLLLYPKMPPSELLERTFFSLLMRGHILVEYEWKTWRDGRQKKYTRIAPGPRFDIAKAKPYELPLLEPLKNMPDDYSYYFKNYLVSVTHHIHGLKYYEKDLVSTSLLKSGLIKKFHWVLNKYVPTENGKARVKELRKTAQLREKQISEWNRQSDPHLDFVRSIKTELLLLDNFKTVISNLKEKVMTEFIPEVARTPLLQIFDADFDIYEFEEAYDEVKTPKKLNDNDGNIDV